MKVSGGVRVFGEDKEAPKPTKLKGVLAEADRAASTWAFLHGVAI